MLTRCFAYRRLRYGKESNASTPLASTAKNYRESPRFQEFTVMTKAPSVDTNDLKFWLMSVKSAATSNRRTHCFPTHWSLPLTVASNSNPKLMLN